MGVDTYSTKARALPAILVVLPAALAAAVWFPNEWAGWGIGTGMLTSSGLLALMTELARDPGKRREPELFERWGGKPTTQLLRHSDTTIDAVTKRRYHEHLGQMVPGIKMPTAAREAANPAAADDVYSSCTKYLIERARSAKDFPLVFKELKSYGFRRTLWGMKPVGLTLAATGLVATAIRAVSLRGEVTSPTALIASLVIAMLLVAWSFQITSNWIRLVAFAYAQSLLASCDRIAVTAKQD